MSLLFPTEAEVATVEVDSEVPAPEVSLPEETPLSSEEAEGMFNAGMAQAVAAKSAMPGTKDALFSSAKNDGDGNDNWGTPDWLFGFLNQNFGPFSVDTCADALNTKVDGSFFDEAQDGLAQQWTGKCWCNPPYSNVAAWVKKAYDSVYTEQTAERVVLLVANRTETEWFHEFATKGLVFFLRTRVAFVEPKGLKPLIDPKTGKAKKRNSPTFGSIVIVFDRNIDDAKRPEIAGTRVMIAQAVDWTSFKPAKKAKGQ